VGDVDRHPCIYASRSSPEMGNIVEKRLAVHSRDRQCKTRIALECPLPCIQALKCSPGCHQMSRAHSR
jgi:hypothetical protein